ncbi:LytTR family DNA-binding domain-containing protein [Cohnella hongkongensis]|uniref:LytTR family DNA-binding domain-containing protein n=1 Tax=Cohnella hongkongensis TaxID=178337 RepID=A0ABV9FDU8_9BACL
MRLPLMNSRGEHRLLDVKEIVYLQTNGAGKMTIYSYDDEYKLISTVKELSDLLQESGFLRTDRGTLIHPERVEAFDGILNIVKLRTMNGEIIAPVSSKAQKQIKTYLKSLKEVKMDED